MDEFEIDMGTVTITKGGKPYCTIPLPKYHSGSYETVQVVEEGLVGLGKFLNDKAKEKLSRGGK